MRFFKDTTFVSWLVILLVAGGLALFANYAGKHPESLGLDEGSAVSAVAAYRSDADIYVDQLRQVAPYGIAGGVDPEALSSWATEVKSVAQKGMEERASEGVSTSDELYSSFNRITLEADTILTQTDQVRDAAARTQILLAIDRATFLVRGYSVAPTIPEGGDDPYGNHNPLNNPTVTQPKKPVEPNIPTGELDPQFDLTKPNPSDLRDGPPLDLTKPTSEALR